MQKSLLRSIVSTTLFLGIGVYGQTCFQYPGNVCKNAFSELVSAQGLTFEAAEGQAAYYEDLIRPISFVYPQCYQATMEFLCLGLFKPCYNGPFGPVPSAPCLHTCARARSLCEPVIEQVNPLLQCDGLPVDDLPVPGYKCFNDTYTGIALQQCPKSNMIVREDGDGPCSPRCSGDYYSKEEEDMLYDVSIAASWISFSGAFMVLLTWLIFPFKRTFPSNMVAYIAFSSVMAAIGQLMNMADPSEFQCENEWTIADQSSSPGCLIQGLILHFFPLTIASWWLCVAVNLHQMIVFKNKNSQALQKYYHAFAWGLPLILVIIAVSTCGYELETSGFRVCTLAQQAYSDGLFLAWFMIFGGIGFGLILHVVYVLYKSSQNMKGIPGSSRNIIRAQIRSIIFLAYYYGIVISLVSLANVAAYSEDEGKKDLESYFLCLFKKTSSAYKDLECSYDYVVRLSDVVYCTLIVYGQGIFLFFTFMTTDDSIGCWKMLFQQGSVDYNPTSYRGKGGQGTSSETGDSSASKSGKELETMQDKNSGLSSSKSGGVEL
eukprot:TRINITY_DN3379_c0_g1_i1.p1 TRINITY_DN3379_c0_g1~~TRINITY_DN3379_c0_g1_i1.p1  ORF type:complete len:546 (-),score=76.56 TRINITY_DN3379_c0_g1_i1:266-1903(-)